VLGFSACIMPGPFQAYLIAETLRRGWRRGALVSLAPLVGDGPAVLVVLLLLSRVPGWMLGALQVVGGLYVLYLAWRAWRTGRASQELGGAASAAEKRRSLLQAVTVNLLNPSVYLYWGTVSGPLLTQGWREGGLGLAFGYLASFYGALVGTELAIVALVSGVRRLKPGLTRWLLGASALLMAGLGISQIVHGIAGLLA
jgi:threonine/homoserine/homoserine lactone efflux protein